MVGDDMFCNITREKKSEMEKRDQREKRYRRSFVVVTADEADEEN